MVYDGASRADGGPVSVGNMTVRQAVEIEIKVLLWRLATETQQKEGP